MSGTELVNDAVEHGGNWNAPYVRANTNSRHTDDETKTAPFLVVAERFRERTGYVCWSRLANAYANA